MNVNNFIEKFAEAIDADAPETLTCDTVFRNLDEWSSLSLLSLISMLDEEYDIQIENAQLQTLQTIGDIIAYIERIKE